MKKLLLALLVTVCMASPALAMEDMSKGRMMDKGDMMGKAPVDFETAKAKHLEAITKHIAALEKKRDCISAAQDKDAVKECKKAHKDSMKDRKEEWKEMRKERKEGMKDGMKDRMKNKKRMMDEMEENAGDDADAADAAE